MMHLPRSARIAAFATLFAFVCAAFAQMPSEEELVPLPTEWAARYNAHDLEALSMLYTEDAVIMPPNAELAEGREAVVPIISAYLEAGAEEIDVHALESYAIQGDSAWGSGPYRLFDVNGEIVGVGKYLILYRVVDDEWKIARHIWNSDLPPAAAE